ncbi:polyamine ABC transporter substrate-binding protein [Pseudomonas sp. PSKL.D1]|uniref:polyamine ABC transporter substrate-binding protein n=1 Tax=Pseudomonas sp. PSKL.D1 TaxID=3029060 RepID=UPI00238136B9|nr:polyamine ABC transporter substrate-binding protein [Pseudomonas sp. PSKL.D1]WDY55768.1 polyamine ABC transporter substrate-binding protein [Pseudomonas sp. PSKL.D1]
MKKPFSTCTAALLLSATCLWANAAPAGGELRIYNWIEYLPKDVLQDFQKESGIKVIYDVFDSPQTLEARLLTGTAGYDVAFPSSSQVPNLIGAGALQPLQRQQLPHWQQLDAQFMHQRENIDPGNRYSVPYLWGSTLLGYNQAKVEAVLGKGVDMRDYDLIFKPENIAKLSQCGVAILDSPTEIVPITLRYLGLNPNSTDPDDFAKAEAALKAIRPYVRYFNSAKYPQDLANGDICVALGWSGGMLAARNMALAANNGNDIRMALPRQGTLMWSDDMVIPKDAQNLKQAHAFIDYLLRPEVIARVTNQIGYPNPNTASTALVAPELLNEKNLFVPEEDRHQLFQVEPPHRKVLRLMTRLWNRVRSDV